MLLNKLFKVPLSYELFNIPFQVTIFFDVVAIISIELIVFKLISFR